MQNNWFPIFEKLKTWARSRTPLGQSISIAAPATAVTSKFWQR